MTDILVKSGIQTIEHLTETRGNGRIRKEVARAHGFRKKVTTDMIRSKVNPECREMMLGHSIGLGNSYYRPNVSEMLEEYLKAVDLLTISDANRLKNENKYLKVQMS